MVVTSGHVRPGLTRHRTLSYNTRVNHCFSPISDRQDVQAISELSHVKPGGDTFLTIGVFDGVHLGHQHLLKRLVERATAGRCLSGVVTFSRHPRRVLAHQSRLPQLTTLEERSRLLRDLSVDLVVPLSFNADLARLSAREFAELLVEHLRMKGLVVGPDFAMGRGREGNVTVLRALGRELGFGVEEVEPFTLDGEVVSSTGIRQALSQGEMKTASRLLGKYFRLCGRVESGVERGRQLGYPTANIAVDREHALPPDGVYATVGLLGDEVYRSATNIGVRPTFDEGERTIEVFLIDFAGDIYGQEVCIDFVERLRGEAKFGSVEELTAQIGRDVEQARAVLSRVPTGATRNG